MVSKMSTQKPMKASTYQKAYRAKKEGKVKRAVTSRVQAQKAANARYGGDDPAQRRAAGSLDKAIKKAVK